MGDYYSDEAEHTPKDDYTKEALNNRQEIANKLAMWRKKQKQSWEKTSKSLRERALDRDWEDYRLKDIHELPELVDGSDSEDETPEGAKVEDPWIGSQISDDESTLPYEGEELLLDLSKMQHDKGGSTPRLEREGSGDGRVCNSGGGARGRDSPPACVPEIEGESGSSNNRLLGHGRNKGKEICKLPRKLPNSEIEQSCNEILSEGEQLLSDGSEDSEEDDDVRRLYDKCKGGELRRSYLEARDRWGEDHTRPDLVRQAIDEHFEDMATEGPPSSSEESRGFRANIRMGQVQSIDPIWGNQLRKNNPSHKLTSVCNLDSPFRPPRQGENYKRRGLYYGRHVDKTSSRRSPNSNTRHCFRYPNPCAVPGCRDPYGHASYNHYKQTPRGYREHMEPSNCTEDSNSTSTRNREI